MHTVLSLVYSWFENIKISRDFQDKNKLKCRAVESEVLTTNNKTTGLDLQLDNLQNVFFNKSPTMFAGTASFAIIYYLILKVNAKKCYSGN